MAFHVFPKLILALLAATAVLSADLWSCTGNSATMRTIGYYDTNYAGTECGQYPESLVAAGYTHINAAYAWIDPGDFNIAFMSNTDDEVWRRLTSLKQTNPGLQVWLSVGGWRMNNNDELTSDTFHSLVSGSVAEKGQRQEAFVNSLLSVLEEYGFDGVDFDWAYPTNGYSDFLYNLRLDLETSGYGYGLSCTLPKSGISDHAFDISTLQHTVDWFNVMTYDIDNNTSSGTSLLAHSNLTEFEDALTPLREQSVDPAKVTLGLEFYGRSFTTSGSTYTLGLPGACDDAPGYLSYDQVLSIVEDDSVAEYYDQDAAVKIVTYNDGNQWMTYDDKETFAVKVEWASSHCIGGLNVWGIDLDGQGKAIEALSGSTQQLQKSAADRPNPKNPLSECQWTDCIDSVKTCSGRGHGGTGGQSCQEQCPAGTTESWRSYGNNACGASGQYRLFCCPNLGRPDICHVRKESQGFQAHCMGRCSGSEVKIGADTSNCLCGWNEICCSRSDALTSMQQCSWTTTCSSTAQCPAARPNQLISGIYGDGGVPCAGSNRKLLCCGEPSPYLNCYWDMGPFGKDDCRGSCSPPYSTVAGSTGGCTHGQQALCCTRTFEDERTSYMTSFLNIFLDNQTCPLPMSTRDIVGPGIDAHAVSTIEVRDDLSDFPALDGVLAWTAVMLGRSAFSSTMRWAWDNSIGVHSIPSWQLALEIRNRPEDDPASIIEQSICNIESAKAEVEQFNDVSTEVCELAWNHTELDAPDVDNRVFHDKLDTTEAKSQGSTRINTGALLERIMETQDVPFLYSRVIRYNNPHANPLNENGEPILGTPRPEIDLEVVYDLRQAPDLQERQGTDIFAVFHFHVAGMARDPNNPQDTELYSAAHYSHVYHGQRVYNANPNDPTNSAEWRVDYGQNRPRRRRNAPPPPPAETERTPIYRCDANTFWYPGSAANRERADAEEANDQTQSRIQQFGVRLRDQGIFSTHTIRNWNQDDETWFWDAGRPDQGREWPNRGLSGDGFELPPADMRPDGPNHWPKYEPPAPQNPGNNGGQGS